MLGKLICYDSRVQGKKMGGIYLVALALAAVYSLLEVLARAVSRKLGYEYLSQGSGFARLAAFAGFLLQLAAYAAILVVVAVCVVFVIAYFRRNLLRDEGYLMHTLPVPAWQLFLSKILTGTLFSWLSVGVSWVCYCIIKRRFALPKIVVTGGEYEGTLLLRVLLVLLFAFLIPTFLSQFYASLCLGYTLHFKTASQPNRDVVSAVAYVAIWVIEQVISVAALIGWVMRYIGAGGENVIYENMDVTANQLISFSAQLLGLLLFLLVASMLALCAVSIRRLGRHLDLS